METLASHALALTAALLAIPVAVFCLEIVAALALPQRQRRLQPNYRPRRRVAVLVPAHNESIGLLPTLANINSQLHPPDRLLVVADNCQDDTAAVARDAGAEVVERHDLSRVGKGYALDCGLRHLGADPPEFVVFIDADCKLADCAIDRLVERCAQAERPVQALYLMTAPTESQINHQVAEFAWRVKNWVRPLGLTALGLPCQLVGTGMAFPWEVIRTVDLASGWIVEDLKLGLDLASAGHAPLFCPAALVTSRFASSVKGTGIQRKRWEQGHISTITKLAPGLLVGAIRRQHWELLALTLDLLVPPLSLLAVLVVGIWIASLGAALFGISSAALTISSASLLLFLATAVLAWINYGREVLPLGAILLVAPYVVRKLGLYRQIASGKAAPQWIRTEREKSK